jgi:hypothetical protein
MKIDVTKIPNFDTLPDDAKEAILGMEFAETPDMTQFISKAVFDKKAKEAADLSKQLKAKMTEDELAKAQADENMAAIMAELEQLRAEKIIGENATKFMELGYDSKLAQATAEAMAKGEMDTVFKNHAKFIADRDKAVRAEILKNTPTPPAGEGEKPVTREDYAKMSLDEKSKFATANPDKVREFYGGN